MKKLFLGLALLAGSLGIGYGCNNTGDEQAKLIAKTKRDYPAYVVAVNLDNYVISELNSAKVDISEYRSGKHTHWPSPDTALERLNNIMININNVSLNSDQDVKNLEGNLIYLQNELTGIKRNEYGSYYEYQRTEIEGLVSSFEVIKNERLNEVPKELRTKIDDLNFKWWNLFLLSFAFGIPGAGFLVSYFNDRKRRNYYRY
ncbi:hypothetical protein HZA97_06670 [Candidatus Woesearchaeota archaeon]|nr:hypothetical protein [Candidatus Woesearchaeota archaeon]